MDEGREAKLSYDTVGSGQHVLVSVPLDAVACAQDVPHTRANRDNAREIHIGFLPVRLDPTFTARHSDLQVNIATECTLSPMLFITRGESCPQHAPTFGSTDRSLQDELQTKHVVKPDDREW